MELTKIRSLSDEELKHHEKTSAEQLFRIRFQVAMGQNDGVKKLRQLRKEIAQVKTVARERELGIHSESSETEQAAPAAEPTTEKTTAEKTAPAKTHKAKAPAKAKAAKVKKAPAKTAAKAKPAKKAAASAKKKTGKAKRASK
ncbi:MAG TPA: 50S ribosomal protein L29 [Terracidiphilus sp.]|nr:50S ribosomal protein L29 [Terracidiphilus sp.]